MIKVVKSKEKTKKTPPAPKELALPTKSGKPAELTDEQKAIYEDAIKIQNGSQSGTRLPEGFAKDFLKDLETVSNMSVHPGEGLTEEQKDHMVAIGQEVVKGHLEGPDPVVATVEMSPEGKMTWTGMPSVKSVQEAEMLLKAAGVETGKKGKCYYVELQLLPIHKVAIYDVFVITVDGHEIEVPWELRGIIEQGTEFCVFKVQEQNRTFYVIMDSESQFELTAPIDTRYWGRARGISSPAVLFLYKSSSYNDHPVGESFLANVTSRNNLLNGVRLFRTWVQSNPPWQRDRNSFPLDQEFLPPYVNIDRRPPTFAKGRMLVEDSQLKRTDIHNSTVTKGTYTEARIYNSRVEGSVNVNIHDSTINDSHIEGARVELRNSHVLSTRLRADDNLVLRHTRLNQLNRLFGKNLYIVNKFCFLVMDMPAGELAMTRSSAQEFVLNYGGMYSKPLILKSTEEEVRKVVSTVISFDEEGFPINNRINEDLVDYLTQSVMSRLGVIRMLDDTVALSHELIGSGESYNSIYEP